MSSSWLPHAFTARLGRCLGVSPEVAGVLAGRVVRRLGARRHAVRVTAFLVATSPPGRYLPAGLRSLIGGPYLAEALRDLGDLLFLLGLAESPETTSCGGLVSP
jgi:hypothetical protein